MIPQLLWLMALAIAGALAWRAISEGGPWAGWAWAAIGGLALAVFAGEAWQALPTLIEAISREHAWDPNPRLQLHTALLALLVLLRPARGRESGP